MASLSDLAGSKGKRITLRFESGAEIRCLFQGQRISGKDLKVFTQLASSMGSLKDNPAEVIGSFVDMAAAFVVKVVDEWDLTKDNSDELVPLTVDAVSDFGLEVLFEIMGALIGAVRMGEARGRISSTHSRSMPSSRSRSSSSR